MKNSLKANIQSGCYTKMHPYKYILIKDKIPLSLVIAYVIDIIYGFLYYRILDVGSPFDTYSYFAAAENIMKGKPDLLRTPFYPLFLHLCETISKENGRQISAIIQIVVFYISIYFFYRLIEQFTSSSIMAGFGTVCYGCMTSVISFNVILLTESFSVSGTVIFTYFLIKFFKDWKYGRLTFCIILSFFMIMLRPSALYLFIVDIAAFVALAVKITRKHIQHFKRYLIPFGFYIAGIAFLLFYISLNARYNHYNGLSYVSEMNKFYDIVQADIWQDNSDTVITDSITAKLDNNSGLLGSAIQTEAEFRDMENAPSRIKHFNDEAIKKHRTEYIYYLLKKALIMGSTHMEYNYTMDSSYLKENANRKIIWPGDLLDFNINFVYFTALILFINIVSIFIIHKQVLIPEFFLFLVIAGQLSINILAGPGEFHRLNITCYPMSILLLAAWAGNALERQNHAAR